MNEALQSAMSDAGYTPRRLAYTLGVSLKQVDRWLKDGDLTPRDRNRADAARALGVDEEMLWPQVVKDKIKTGSDRELIHSYPYRSACPNTTWGQLVSEAESEIFLAGYTNYFFWTQVPNFGNILRQKVDRGVRVRFLLGDPDGEVTRQREVIEDTPLTVSMRIRICTGELEKLALDGVEARYSAAEDAVNHVSLSVFRMDHDALVTPHLARLVGHDSPLLHLRRVGEGGMFDRFAEHAEELWSRAVPVR